MGPIGLVSLTYLVEYACYNEVLKLGLRICDLKNNIFLKKWCWILFLVVHWIVIANDIAKSDFNFDCVPLLGFIFKYNMAFGLAAYLSLIVCFVLAMKSKNYLNR